MLKECFHVHLQPINAEIHQTAICDFCIGRLRDAHCFWMQVLESESKILKKLKEISDEVRVEKNYHSQLSLGTKADPISEYDSFADMGVDSEEDIKPIPIKIEIEDVEKQDVKKKEKRIKFNNQNETPELQRKSSRVMKKVKSVRVQLLKELTKRTIGNKLQEYNSRVNAFTILENTTSSPFRWSSQKGFMCFYCSKPHPNIESLRAHTETHKQDKLKSLVNKKSRQRFIKVDITVLGCRLCSKKFEKLPDIKTHLVSVHKKKFMKAQHDNVLPYRLSNTDLNCAICEKSFTNFHTLNMHMNTHFGNYVCESCGATFINEERLNIHLSTHENGVYPCNSCNKNFNSPVKLSNHKAVAHSSRNHRCHSCGETFKSFHLKQTHRIKVHDEKHLLHICEFCNKSYPRRSHLNYHIRRTHLREKNYVCEVCSDGFFSKKELTDHTLKHSGEKSHECEVCHKRFGRKHSLVEHTRIHNNDRRFVCAYCGQGFIQKCSLKGHLKTHHSVTLE
ncbi:Zinc finger protein 430 [Eumeta japonica]|uniref:Zinc finger protein 430 n=1 Tax=Eumeta variegata TaxID=151549 RepID=A0A4C1VUG8_EUMVA|nr:Zinc finger protein 430 [Eumeta japonica]